MKRTFEIDLLIGGYSYSLTDDLKNWDDVKLSFERSDYGGVIKSFSTKFEFVGVSYSLIKQEYLTNYLSSSSSVVVYTINNSRLRSEKFRCALDFSTLEDDGSTIFINAIDNTLASIIKSKKSTVYDIPVSDIKLAKPLLYDRLMMYNACNWIITGETVETETTSYVTNTYTVESGLTKFFAVPIYIKDSGNIFNKNFVEVYDVQKSTGAANEDVSFLKCLKPISCHISLKFSLWVHFSGAVSPINVYITRVRNNVGLWLTPSLSITEGANNISAEYDVDLQKGDLLQFQFSIPPGTVEIYQFLPTTDEIKITFNAREDSVDLDIISPLQLLKSLIQNIYGSPVDCSISLNDRMINTLICAAESIRGLANAKIHTSYSKFADFMSAEFGYVPVISSNSVAFVHRNSLFINEVVKSFGTNHSDFKFNVESALIYSSVKVGYDKQDYDSVNGRDEFRFTNEFTTGKTLTDNSLSLISPYRADAYGIEFLANKRGEDTTDDQSDNDVFIIGAIQDINNYYLDRTATITGILSPNTMFNAMFSPKAMLVANESYIGVTAELLTFSSTEGNGDVVVNGISEKDNLIISNRLFKAEKSSIDVSDLNVPSNLTKAVDFVKNGKKYRGFVMGIDYNITKDSPVTYNLLIQGIYDENS